MSLPPLRVERFGLQMRVQQGWPAGCLVPNHPPFIEHEAALWASSDLPSTDLQRTDWSNALSLNTRFPRLLALAVGVTLAISAAAQTKPTVSRLGATDRSFLWVGNSFFYYNNSMHGHVSRLAAEADSKGGWRGVSITISGSGLDWHDLEAYLRPGGVGRYSFVGDNQIRFNSAGRQFDAAIMMDCSQCPVHPQLQQVFHDTVKKNAEILARQGAKPVLFMSWAYEDKPEMTAQLAEQYTTAGNANNALVIPAGLAFAKAIEGRPGLKLYVPDKRHPSLAGTYLAACTVWAALSGKSPVGLGYNAGLEPELAAYLQQVAWSTVQSYYGR